MNTKLSVIFLGISATVERTGYWHQWDLSRNLDPMTEYISACLSATVNNSPQFSPFFTWVNWLWMELGHLPKVTQIVYRGAMDIEREWSSTSEILRFPTCSYTAQMLGAPVDHEGTGNSPFTHGEVGSRGVELDAPVMARIRTPAPVSPSTPGLRRACVEEN